MFFKFFKKASYLVAFLVLFTLRTFSAHALENYPPEAPLCENVNLHDLMRRALQGLNGVSYSSPTSPTSDISNLESLLQTRDLSKLHLILNNFNKKTKDTIIASRSKKLGYYSPIQENDLIINEVKNFFEDNLQSSSSIPDSIALVASSPSTSASPSAATTTTSATTTTTPAATTPASASAPILSAGIPSNATFDFDKNQLVYDDLLKTLAFWVNNMSQNKSFSLTEEQIPDLTPQYKKGNNIEEILNYIKDPKIVIGAEPLSATPQEPIGSKILAPPLKPILSQPTQSTKGDPAAPPILSTGILANTTFNAETNELNFNGDLLRALEFWLEDMSHKKGVLLSPEKIKDLVEPKSVKDINNFERIVPYIQSIIPKIASEATSLFANTQELIDSLSEILAPPLEKILGQSITDDFKRLLQHDLDPAFVEKVIEEYIVKATVNNLAKQPGLSNQKSQLKSFMKELIKKLGKNDASFLLKIKSIDELRKVIVPESFKKSFEKSLKNFEDAAQKQNSSQPKTRSLKAKKEIQEDPIVEILNKIFRNHKLDFSNDPTFVGLLARALTLKNENLIEPPMEKLKGAFGDDKEKYFVALKDLQERLLTEDLVTIIKASLKQANVDPSNVDFSKILPVVSTPGLIQVEDLTPAIKEDLVTIIKASLKQANVDPSNVDFSKIFPVVSTLDLIQTQAKDLPPAIKEDLVTIIKASLKQANVDFSNVDFSNVDFSEILPVVSTLGLTRAIEKTAGIFFKGEQKPAALKALQDQLLTILKTGIASRLDSYIKAKNQPEEIDLYELTFKHQPSSQTPATIPALMPPAAPAPMPGAAPMPPIALKALIPVAAPILSKEAIQQMLSKTTFNAKKKGFTFYDDALGEALTFWIMNKFFNKNGDHLDNKEIDRKRKTLKSILKSNVKDIKSFDGLVNAIRSIAPNIVIGEKPLFATTQELIDSLSEILMPTLETILKGQKVLGGTIKEAFEGLLSRNLKTIIEESREDHIVNTVVNTLAKQPGLSSQKGAIKSLIKSLIEQLKMDLKKKDPDTSFLLTIESFEELKKAQALPASFEERINKLEQAAQEELKSSSESKKSGLKAKKPIKEDSIEKIIKDIFETKHKLDFSKNPIFAHILARALNKGKPIESSMIKTLKDACDKKDKIDNQKDKTDYFAVLEDLQERLLAEDKQLLAEDLVTIINLVTIIKDSLLQANVDSSDVDFSKMLNLIQAQAKDLPPAIKEDLVTIIKASLQQASVDFSKILPVVSELGSIQAQAKDLPPAIKEDLVTIIKASLKQVNVDFSNVDFSKILPVVSTLTLIKAEDLTPVIEKIAETCKDAQNPAALKALQDQLLTILKKGIAPRLDSYINKKNQPEEIDIFTIRFVSPASPVRAAAIPADETTTLPAPIPASNPSTTLKKDDETLPKALPLPNGTPMPAAAPMPPRRAPLSMVDDDNRRLKAAAPMPAAPPMPPALKAPLAPPAIKIRDDETLNKIN